MKIIGHRGARGIAPENTLEGFGKAMEYDIDMIEMDVRQTKDHVLIIVHKRLQGFSRYPGMKISEHTYADLKALAPDIPTLAETIEFVDRRIRMMIEIKKDVPPEPVIKLIKTYLKKGWQPEDFMFNSNRYRILRKCYELLPEVDRLIQGNFSGLRAMYLAKKLHTSYILLDQRYLWWGFVRLSHRLGFKLFTYTFPWVKYEPYNHFKAERWEKHGLYAIITDYPDHFKK